MSPLRLSLLTAAAAGALAAAMPARAADTPLKVVDPASIDTSAAPCDNFYQYACGNWIKNNPIPADRPAWISFSLIQERNEARLRDILEQAAAHPDGDVRKIGDYYAACMDEAGIEAKGTAPVKPELDRIDALADRKDLPALLAHLHEIGVPAFFEFSSTQDFADATRVIAGADQGGLGLPDRDYYLRTDPDSVALRKAYVAHVAQMLTLLGEPKDRAAKDAHTVMAIETELAKASLDLVARRDPKNLDHKLTRAAFADLSSGVAGGTYLQDVNPPAFQDVQVTWPDFFKGADQVVASRSVDDLKAYLRWHLVHAVSGVLPKAFVDESFSFYGRTLSGQKELEARWKRCVRAVDGALGEDLGKAYVARYFPPAAKEDTLALIRSVESAYAEDIKGLDWMSEETKQKALVKLHAIANKIGYPDKWRDYSALDVRRDQPLQNSLNARGFEFRRQLNKIGKPLDRGEWQMTPPEVNAYYDAQYNDINFPAGILQPSFYDVAADLAANYGAIGAVMGHEMTHGFDDEGRQFDDKGNLKDWWTPADAKAFESRAQCLVDEYGGFTAVGDLKLNGKLTLGENTADNGGVRLAYDALEKALGGTAKPKIDGFTPEQRFFLAYAQVWCTNATDAYKRRAAQTDPHSPGEFRVNGVVRNQPAFARAFQCRTGSPMAPEPAKSCRVW